MYAHALHVIYTASDPDHLRPGVLVTSTGYISSTSVARQVVSLTLGRFHDDDEPMYHAVDSE